MNQQQPFRNSGYVDPPRQAEPGKNLALAGLIVGIVSLGAWFIPIIGFPVAIVGIFLAIMALRSVTRKGVATWALVLSIIGLVATAINSALGAYLATHP